jgi:hypothetical protein
MYQPFMGIEAMKEMIDRAGEPPELRVASAKAIRPARHRLATFLQSVGRRIASRSERPASARPATVTPQTIRGEAAGS